VVQQASLDGHPPHGSPPLLELVDMPLLDVAVVLLPLLLATVVRPLLPTVVAPPVPLLLEPVIVPPLPLLDVVRAPLLVVPAPLPLVVFVPPFPPVPPVNSTPVPHPRTMAAEIARMVYLMRAMLT